MHESNEPKIVLNSIRCPDGTVLVSRHRGDFVEHTQADGRSYAVDGGTEDLLRSYSDRDWEEISVFSNAPHEKIREGFFWGSRGKDGSQPTKYKPLKDLDTDHIEAILKTQTSLPEWRRSIFQEELKFRRTH